jgi:TRAP-type C4-dicarboxylate transport system substrate-binding protein
MMARKFTIPMAYLLLLLTANSAMAVTFKIATIAPDGTSWMREMRKGAEEITRRTESRVKLRFYPGGVMGSDSSVLRKIRVGQLQGGAVLAVGLGSIHPDTLIYGLPFLFRSYQEVDYVRQRMDQELLAGIKDRGFICFGLAETGFAFMMSKHSIRTEADLRARKAWVPEGDRISQRAFETIKVSPVPLPLIDVLTGLQTGLIDTVGSSPVGAIALQWHTQIKYLNDAPLMYLYGALIIQRKAFEKLSAADQAVVENTLTGVIGNLNQQTRRDNERALQALKSRGVNIIRTTVAEKKRWQNAVSGLAHQLSREGVYSPAVLRKIQQHLKAYRR